MVIKERNTTFDMMKGIGILLVIIGHFIFESKHFIYTFHMPLFFILAGIFFTPKEPMKLLRKDFKRLLIPALITATILFIAGIAYDFYTHKNYRDVFNQNILRVLYPTSLVKLNLGGWVIWFLFSLFWCKTIYNVVCQKINGHVVLLVSLILSLFAIFIDTQITNLPLGVLPGIGAIFFFAAGAWFSKYKIKYGRLIEIFLIGCLIIWALYLICGNHKVVNIDLIVNRYSYYPFDILIGIGGTFAIWLLCEYIIKKISTATKFLAFCGMNSLLILCIHAIDYKLIRSNNRDEIFVLTLTILTYIGVVILISKSTKLRRVFGVELWKEMK